MKFYNLKQTILREVKKLNPSEDKPLTKILHQIEIEGDVMSIPLTKSDIVALQDKVSAFIKLCSEYDSTGRVYAWSDLHRVLSYLIQEEEIHNFEFPSPSNPNREEILKKHEIL